MSLYHVDIKRMLADDMRWLLDEHTMSWLVCKCGGDVRRRGENWHVRIGGTRIKTAARAAALNQALDIIAIRPDLWPPQPSAA